MWCADGYKFIGKSFVMSIFGYFAKELPPFEEHLNYIFELKENTTIYGKIEELSFDLICCELLYCKWHKNQASTKLVKTLAEGIV